MLITAPPKSPTGSCLPGLPPCMDTRLAPPAGVWSKLHWNYYSVKIGGYVPCASPDSLRAIYHAEVSHEVVRCQR